MKYRVDFSNKVHELEIEGDHSVQDLKKRISSIVEQSPVVLRLKLENGIEVALDDEVKTEFEKKASEQLFIAAYPGPPSAESPEQKTEDSWGGFAENGFARKDIVTPSGRLCYHAAGNGQVMVLMHGIGGGASSFTWFQAAPLLTSSHRVLVPSMVGWGLSEHPARPILFDDYVAGLEALLEREGGKAIVVAQSLAGGFVLALAEKRPELVARVVLINPTGLRDFGENSFPLFVRFTFAPLARIPWLNLQFYRTLFHRRSFIANWYERQGFADPSLVTAEMIDTSLYSASRENAAYSALPFLTGDVHYDMVPYLERAKVPTSMILCSDTGFVGVRNAERLSKVRDDIGIHILERTKACPELEQPRATVDLIRKIIGGDQGNGAKRE